MIVALSVPLIALIGDWIFSSGSMSDAGQAAHTADKKEWAHSISRESAVTAAARDGLVS
ncbi:MAG: hypothetical protein ABI740_00265 [Alphaproteobacteria bacterium]